MKNSIKNIFNTLNDKPFVSLPAATLGALAIAGAFAVNFLPAGPVQQIATYPLMLTAVASPFITPVLGVTGLFSAVCDRPALSRAFSAAAFGSAAIGMAAFDATLSKDGMEALAAFFYSGAAMIAASSLNLAAHYTRNGGKPPAPPQI